MPAFFISHSHVDKAIARRVARRLGAYGVTTWLDERELRLGDALDSTIEQHIKGCDAVIVISTAQACSSSWVRKEIAFANMSEPAKPVCPIFVEDVKAHPLLADFVGVDATDGQFERAVLKLAEAVLGAPLAEPSAARLIEDIETLKREERGLSLLIDDCLHGTGLAFEHVDRVREVPFHNLDFAINALYDVARDDQTHRVASAAALLFASRGAGMYALERHLGSRRAIDGVLVSAVGQALPAGEIEAALTLLSTSTPPDDQALEGFIRSNAASMNAGQRSAAIELITQPYRLPKNFADEAAFSALQHFPESNDIQWLWKRWIREGLFDEVDSGRLPSQLAYYLSEATHLPNAGGIVEEFLAHLRSLARARDRKKVEIALRHLTAAAMKKSPLVPQIVRELNFATGSAEWDQWPDAQEMRINVHAVVEAAETERD